MNKIPKNVGRHSLRRKLKRVPMLQCKNFSSYKGLRQPRCDGGRGCLACWQRRRIRIRTELRFKADQAKARASVRRIVKITEPLRKFSMPAVLGAPYNLSGSEVPTPAYDVKTGLWGYAQRMTAPPRVSSVLRNLDMPDVVADQAAIYCDACHMKIDGAYASVGGNIEPYIPARYYHPRHVPAVRPDPYAAFASEAWGSDFEAGEVVAVETIEGRKFGQIVKQTVPSGKTYMVRGIFSFGVSFHYRAHIFHLNRKEAPKAYAQGQIDGK